MAVSVSATNLCIDVNSLTGGTVIITIPNPAADKQYGSSLPCRTCYVMQLSGTQAYMDVDTAAAAATGFPLSTTPLEFPIDDINKLHFFGTAGDKVQILWRS